MFLSTPMHIDDTCWFAIILHCVYFKKNDNFTLNTTHQLFFSLRTLLISQYNQVFFANRFLHHLFFFRLIHIIYILSNFFFSLVKSFSNSLKYFLIVKCYFLPLEFCFLSQYFHFYNFERTICLDILLKKLFKMFEKKCVKGVKKYHL